jgi:Uma2 family endonuclease
MMQTLDEIRAALRRLTFQQRMVVELWLQEMDGIPAPDSQVREALPAYAATDPSFMTLEEYFELEKTSPMRHEFINGVLFALSGPSVAHQRIVLNLTVAFSNHLKRGPCEVFLPGSKVLILRDVSKISYYPDVMVDCRPDTRDTHHVRDPKLIVEVLSPSTQIIDRREKLQNYRLIDSVEEYVIVAQDERRVIVYPRAERWKPRVYGTLSAAVEFRSIDLTLPMTELYGDVSGAAA